MPSRRSTIQMTPEEAAAFLAEETVVNVATMGPNSRPHLAPLWYAPRPDLHHAALETWTFRKSQKAANLRRLPQATVLVEAGESYDQLRGLSLECDIELIEDRERVAAIGESLAVRYAPEGATRDEQIGSNVSKQAPKRVGLVCVPTRVVSWDHRKLRGAY